MEDNSRIALINNIVTRNFLFLEEIGYTSKLLNKRDSLFLEDISVQYLNDKIKREISINYTKSNNSGEVMHNLGLSIVKIPYENVSDFFSLNQYLNSLDKKNTMPFPKFNEETLNDNAILLANALKNQCFDIVTGQAWESNFWPKW